MYFLRRSGIHPPPFRDGPYWVRYPECGRRASLLVLDEPWSGLDIVAHGLLADLITDVADAGGSVVFTDHRESIIRAHASRAFVISAGRVTPMEPARSSGQASDVVLIVSGAPESARQVDWYGIDGVLLVTGQVETLTIRVASTCLDALLLTALRDLPPVNVLLRLMANATISADLVSPVSGLLVIAVVVLVSSVFMTQFIATRKE
ncbi:MAG: hypothetical protein ACRDRA_02800 [Pseudonocardiaceae bacterium]